MYANKCFKVILLLIGFWIQLTRCYYYCDDVVGICLYTNRTFVKSWKEALEQCHTNGSILLEIYNEKYKNVVIEAIKIFGLEGWYLLLGLEYTNGQFRWSSGQNMTLSITGMNAFSGNCRAFVVLNNSGLCVHPSCDNKPPNHTFLCLKDINEPHTNEYSTPELTSTNSFVETSDNSVASQGLESTISFFTSPQFTKNISIPQVNNNEQQQQQQKNRIGIGVGVGVALSVFSIALIILTVCIVKKRLKTRNIIKGTVKDINKEEIKENIKESAHSTTNSSNESCLVYADINFMDKTSHPKNMEHLENVDDIYTYRNNKSYHPNDNDNAIID